ncbi:MAG: dihydroorotase family protein [Firmicutes bacterium]|nr:dihydroorotase family protein [Bacillota bacterium]
MTDLWVRGGTVVTARRTFPGDVLVRDGRIAAVVERTSGGAPFSPSGDVRVLDASGLYVLPGLVDVHVHFREPGLTHKEDFSTGTAAAACGGVTTVLEMPNTDPPVSRPAILDAKAARLAGRAYVDYGLYAVIDESNYAELPGLAAAGAIAFKLFLGPTTGDIRAPGWGRLMEVFETVARLGLPLVVHAEDRDVIEYWQARVAQEAAGGDAQDVPGQASAGPAGAAGVDYRRFLATRPRFGEVAATQTVCLLAGFSGARVHIAHVSIAQSVDIIREAKDRGAPVTAETCPPYLLMTAEDCERLGPVAKILPPIRDAADRDRLWQGLAENTLDIIATDHAPHLSEEKEGKPWLTAPGGMIGVETLLPALLTEASRGRLSLNQLVRWTSTRPAEIFGLAPRKGDIRPGADGDLVLVDPGARWTVRAEDLHSKSKASPLLGTELVGRVVHTVLRGQVVVEDGRLVSGPLGERLLPSDPGGQGKE